MLKASLRRLTRWASSPSTPQEPVYGILEGHFSPTPLADLVVTQRTFPSRVRADVQLAIDELVDRFQVLRFLATHSEYRPTTGLTSLMTYSDHYPSVPSAPQYEEVDIGEVDAVRCLKEGLWLFEENGLRAAVYMHQAEQYGQALGMRVEIATPKNSQGAELSRSIFAHLEEAIQRARSYRGKVLSLELSEHYSGKSGGIRVHRLPSTPRDAVILSKQTVDLLERNVVGFMKQRRRLAAAGLPTKKGLLFYGPPGTGKTHTISFLASSLPEVTTLLITAEQVGLLDEYMTLARLLQPSMVVIEDADLIARNRERMDSACEEVLLNKLLNEMDGLRENVDVFFILTTNRPQSLEAALAARPGRIDQSIEFPRPDEDCRRRLLALYAGGLRMKEEVIESTVKRTAGSSAAFLKELVRRAAQVTFDRDGDNELTGEDIEQALDELLFKGGSLNRLILGAAEEGPQVSMG